MAGVSDSTERKAGVEDPQARIRQLEADVEQLRARDALLSQKEAIIHATLESVADGVLVVDDAGVVIFSNKQFARMWHIPPDLMDNGDDNELVQFVRDQLKDPDTFLAKVKELYQSFSESRDTLEFLDGRVFDRYSMPLVVNNRLCGRVWTFRDVTVGKPSRHA